MTDQNIDINELVEKFISEIENKTGLELAKITITKQKVNAGFKMNYEKEDDGIKYYLLNNKKTEDYK